MSTSLVIGLYFSVLATLCRGATLDNAAIIEIETLPSNIKAQFNVDLSALTNVRGGQTRRRQYQTMVNGQPVTIEITREGQLNTPNQQNYMQQYWQERNRYPVMKPNNQNRPNVFITRDPSFFNNPNIEVYDVYTNGGVANNRYPNRYPNRQAYPNGNFFPRPNPNENQMYPYPNQNGQNINIPPYTNQNEQNGDNIYPNPNRNKQNGFNRYPYQPNEQNFNSPKGSETNNQNNEETGGEQNFDLSMLDNTGNQSTEKPKTNESQNQFKKEKNPSKNNVSGYLNNFPIILLNENEIRR